MVLFTALITTPMTWGYSCFIKYEKPPSLGKRSKQRHLVSLVTCIFPATVESLHVFWKNRTGCRLSGAVAGLMPPLLPGLLDLDQSTRPGTQFFQ